MLDRWRAALALAGLVIARISPGQLWGYAAPLKERFFFNLANVGSFAAGLKIPNDSLGAFYKAYRSNGHQLRQRIVRLQGGHMQL